MADQRKKIATIPVNLIIGEKKALILGGGKSAYKYLLELISSGIKIDLISQNISEEINSIANQYTQITLIRQPFDLKSLQKGHYLLAYITTDTNEFEPMIMEELQQNGILTCTRNSSQYQGDVTQPIRFNSAGTEVSLITEGYTNRRTRALKEYLYRHAEEIKDVTLKVIGTDHNIMNLEEREPFHLNDQNYSKVAEQLSLVAGIQEFFLLNTCNRIEIYTIVSSSNKVKDLIKKILNFDHLSPHKFYVKSDNKAFIHLGLVLSGILAQIPGETHVVKQLKETVKRAKTENHMGGLLQQVFDNCLFISKKIRNKITPLISNQEIEDITVNFLLENIPEISEKKILIIGSGVVGNAMLRKLIPHRPEQIYLCYRSNRPNISENNDCQVSVFQINQLREILPMIDVILMAADTNRLVLHMGHALFLKQEKTVNIIDICVPRSVDPDLGKVPNLNIVDMEELKNWHRMEVIEVEELKRIGTEEFKSMIHRYEKIFDKEWMPEE